VKGDEPLSRYLSSIAQIEQRTGLRFLTNLSAADHNRLASDISTNPAIWQLDRVDRISARY
jgi:endonuclease G